MTILKVIVGCVCMVIVLNLFNLNDSYWITLSMFDRFRSIGIIVVSAAVVYFLVIAALGVFGSLKVSRS